MKQTLKYISLFILTCIITMIFFPNTLHAENSTNNSAPNSIFCQMYSSDGVLLQEGLLPTSEQEYNSRRDYASFTLPSGSYLQLGDVGGYPFRILETTTVYFKFGLSRNINAIVQIAKSDLSTNYRYWYGLTGGLSTSANVPANVSIYGIIGNNSSDPVTVNWASINY